MNGGKNNDMTSTSNKAKRHEHRNSKKHQHHRAAGSTGS